MVAASAIVKKEDGQASIVACGDAAPVLQAAEHDLDATAASVVALIVFDGEFRFPGRNAGRYALFLGRAPLPVCATAAVGEHPLRFGQMVQ